MVERDAYTIEKLIFDSRPGFPGDRQSVHSQAGCRSRGPASWEPAAIRPTAKPKAYQSFAQGLARLGYVCLIYDPIGQGERLQYVKDDLTSRVGVGVREHLYAGNQQFLVGEFLGMWRAWDGIRALDYLLTRQEVDPQQIGVTGNSGGGTMTTWLCGVEPRWTMAAPSCFVTSFRRNMENELPADTEQCPPKALALGLDHADFLAAQAPDPVRILAKERDYFDVRGNQEALWRLKRLYRLLGHEDNISRFVGPTTHGFTQENREAMYEWFGRATGATHGKSNRKSSLEEEQKLWCTPEVRWRRWKTHARCLTSRATSHNSWQRSARTIDRETLLRAVRDVLKIGPVTPPPGQRPGNWPAFRILRARRTPAIRSPMPAPTPWKRNRASWRSSTC